MSYTRDRDHATRAPGAIAARDLAHPRAARARQMQRAHVTALRDRALAGLTYATRGGLVRPAALGAIKLTAGAKPGTPVLVRGGSIDVPPLGTGATKGGTTGATPPPSRGGLQPTGGGGILGGGKRNPPSSPANTSLIRTATLSTGKFPTMPTGGGKGGGKNTTPTPTPTKPPPQDGGSGSDKGSATTVYTGSGGGGGGASTSGGSTADPTEVPADEEDPNDPLLTNGELVTEPPPAGTNWRKIFLIGGAAIAALLLLNDDE